MMESIPLRTLYRGTSILADYWEQKETLRSLIPRHFRDPQAFPEQQRLLAGRRYDRETLRLVLREQNEGLGAGRRSLANVDMLADPRSVVVIGGQQAGLFGGPLYTVHKALTILALADHVSALLGCPAVPIFWIASEDSDIAEIDHAHLTDREGRLLKVSLPPGTTDKIPVARVRLGREVGAALEAVAAALPETDLAAVTLSALREAYAPDSTYPAAFGAWMHHLLRDRGIVTVDPADPRLKRIASGLFAREIEEKGPVGRAVIRQSQRLAANGYQPQVELRDGILTLFYQDPVRDSIVVDGQGFQLKNGNRRVSLAEMRAIVQESPEKLTPNAVLRPLFQDSLFPTAAVVLGPAELAYWAQLGEAYAAAGIPMPVLFPRASLTLIEPAVGKLLDLYGLALSDVVTRGERIIDVLARREVPPDLFTRLTEGRKASADMWSRYAREVTAFEKTLSPTAENASRAIQNRFLFMEKKLIKAARRKDDVLRRRVERIISSLYPRAGLQERTLTALPFVARYGAEAAETAARGISLFAPEHRGVRLPV